MTALPDAIAQSTLWGLDDSRAKKEKLRKVMAPKVDPAMPSGDCCQRCRQWTAPEEGDAFGLCGLLVVVTERKIDFSKGEILSITEAVAGGCTFEAMAVKGFASGCLGFVGGSA